MESKYQVSGIRYQGRQGTGKRGQIFSGILVLITLLMCGVSIMVYLQQQEAVQSSLVSPLVVLKVRDAKTVFEMREGELILSSLKSVNGEFGSDEFLEEFWESFVSEVKGDEDIRKFIFLNWTLNGRMMLEDNGGESFLENVVYNKDNFKWKDGLVLEMKRGEIGKSFELKAQKMEDVNFAVDFDFVFSEEYLIREVGGDFVVSPRDDSGDPEVIE